MSQIVYLDGEFLPRSEAKVSVDDRGFVFGDGIYEVTRAFDGRLFEAERHMARLEQGLRGLEIALPDAERERIPAVSERLLRDNDLLAGEATVYLQITRGAALRTHFFPPVATRPTVYLSAMRFVPPAALRERGGTAITQPDIRWTRCDLKTVNLLPNCLAKQRAVAAGATEAIFVRDGALTEGAQTNVFGVIDGVVRTYPKCNYILPGVTRDVVLEVAAELGIEVRETPIYAEEISRLEELFITSTTSDVLPIVQLDGRPVGDGTPGPITRALYERFMARIPVAEALIRS